MLRERDDVEFIVKGENKNGPSAVCVKLLASVSILNEEEIKKAKDEKKAKEEAEKVMSFLHCGALTILLE